MAEIKYKECLRNHAAPIGRVASDGCGEFLINQFTGTLLCAACGCHRNFHRKVVPDQSSTSDGLSIVVSPVGAAEVVPEKRKRGRTIFTAEQKIRMKEFGLKMGWKLSRYDSDEIERFCSEIGIRRRALKYWMGNNRHLKHTG